MPFSILQKLGLKEPTLFNMILQLTDRSITYPRGILEDVLVKVDKFIFPIDFVVLDIEEDHMVPLILGKPFLITVRALIDVQKGNMILMTNYEQITFDVYKDSKFPSKDDTCFSIDAIDRFVDMSIQESKCLDQCDEHNGAGMENEDNIDTPFESYSMSRLDEAFEKEDPEEFLNLLELALKNPPSDFTPCPVEHKPLEPKTSPVNDTSLEKPISTLVFPYTLLTDEQQKPVDLEPESLEKIIDWREILSMSEEIRCLFERKVRERAKLSRLDFGPAHLSNKKECTETPIPPDPD